MEGEKGLTVKSDIWAFGATLLHALTGKRPWADCAYYQVMMQVSCACALRRVMLHVMCLQGETAFLLSVALGTQQHTRLRLQ